MRERAFQRRQSYEFGRRQSHEFAMRIGSLLLLIWLAIGMIAAGQRHYFETGPINCAGFGTIALTAAAGPLNYLGVNPKIAECDLPEPSQ